MATSGKPQIKAFYYPSPSKGGYPNPYSLHYKKALEKECLLLNSENKCARMLGLDFFIHSFKADLYIVNWLESVGFLRLGRAQFLFAKAGLWIIRQRKKKIVWMFHNIHPHQGDDSRSRSIQQTLFHQADLIVSHSKEAAEYAQKRTHRKVIFLNHPVQPIAIRKTDAGVPPFDVLIWGAILPYKGIAEFISSESIQRSELTVRILGACSDEELSDRIRRHCNGRIIFENRKASFDEIAAYIGQSRYVLFPYIGDCVSSSGALIDTLVLGGTPVGPDTGAFRDLAEKGICLTYKNYAELSELLLNRHSINEPAKVRFFSENSWQNLVKVIQNNL